MLSVPDTLLLPVSLSVWLTLAKEVAKKYNYSGHNKVGVVGYVRKFVEQTTFIVFDGLR